LVHVVHAQASFYAELNTGPYGLRFAYGAKLRLSFSIIEIEANPNMYGGQRTGCP